MRDRQTCEVCGVRLYGSADIRRGTCDLTCDDERARRLWAGRAVTKTVACVCCPSGFNPSTHCPAVQALHPRDVAELSLGSICGGRDPREGGR